MGTTRTSSPMFLFATATIAFVIFLQTSPTGALQQGGELHAALCDSGFAALDRGNVEGARALFEQVMRRDPRYPRALLGMGRVMLETPAGGGRAVEYLIQASEMLPLDISAHYYRALAHMRLAEKDVGRDNIIMARNSLRNVLDLDPSHPDARYQLGILLRDYFEEYEEAEAELEKQIVVNPGHLQARLELVKVKMDLGKWDEAVEGAEDLLNRDPDMLDAYPYLAGAHWKAGRNAEAMEVFGRYFPRLPDEEKNLYLDLSLVLDTDEIKEYESLDAAGRRAYWAHYWRSRDPDPRSDVNERLLEHYIRVAWARISFSRAEFPWDSRGYFYVRYGEPDHKSGRGQIMAWEMVDDDPVFLRQKRELQEEMGLPSLLLETSVFDAAHWDVEGPVEKRLVIAMAESLRFEHPTWTLDEVWSSANSIAERRAFSMGAAATPERWVYRDEGIDLWFEDFAHSGNFTVWGPRSRMLVEEMEKDLPTLSPEEDRIEMIDPMDSVVTFRGEGGKTAVEYAFALLPDEFGAFRSVTGAYATLDVEVNLYTGAWELAAGAGEKSRRLETIPQVQIRGVPLFVDATRMEVEPDQYRLTTLLIDPESGRRARAEEVVDLPDYSGDELMISSILPAALIRPVEPTSLPTFIRGDLEVLPLPGRALEVNQPLFIYYEVYNLSKDQFGATQYQIEYSVSEAPEDRALTTRLFQGVRNLVGRGRRRTGVASSVTSSGISSDLKSYLEIDVSMLPPESYILELHVTDLLTRERTSASLLFRTLPPVP